ncbi:hypothetical protein HMPREF0080_00348 [Anaeroglobus geminatus F0357]|uniref:Uncharacterized protein n=1 Tax=Anaeroglobus geminatus F0357 TaxID=861450 RepID=G9YFD7_9FIRM|nr:hypothetical protein HMPREF0080_00348 [Anaeroglobus geminatus F0357]
MLGFVTPKTFFLLNKDYLYMLHNKLHYNTEGTVCGLYTFSQM